jgi:hypothetical protein
MFVQQRKRRCMIQVESNNIKNISDEKINNSYSSSSSSPVGIFSDSSTINNNNYSKISKTIFPSSVQLSSSQSTLPVNKILYPCRLCGQPFSSSSNRARHEKNVKHKSTSSNTKIKYSKKSASSTVPLSTMLNRKRAPVNSGMDSSSEVDMSDSADSISSHSGSSVSDSDSESESNSGSDSDSSVSSSNIFVQSALPVNEVNVSIEMESGDESKEKSNSPLQQTTPLLGSHNTIGDGKRKILVALQSSKVDSLIQDSVVFNNIPNRRTLLSESDLQNNCYDFLLWLNQSPVTSVESLVKARRMNSLSQLQPIKVTNERENYIFKLIQITIRFCVLTDLAHMFTFICDTFFLFFCFLV